MAAVMVYNDCMDHFRDIYASKAAEYQRMIAAEDADGNLPSVLRQIAEWSGAQVLDLGTGTGRFEQIFRNSGARFTGVDLYRAMLLENRAWRDKHGGDWSLVQADMRALPIHSHSADIVIAGWSIGHLRAWYEQAWQVEIGAILNEMERVVKRDGMLIICETMSTGSLVPQPPTPQLAEYYRWLETHHNFTLEIIPTDYLFNSVEQAAEYSQFFFGDELAGQIRANAWQRLPEWTGIWYKSARMI
jgi:ubiquinone/menaquinone biosynthesis C-methylase UbiE